MTAISLTPNLPVVKLNTAELRADPYAVYARLRREAPVALGHAPFMGDLWLVTQYADVVAVLKDARFSSNMASANSPADQRRQRWMPRLFRLMQDSMVLTDDPVHQRLRSLVHLAFTPKRVERLAARVDAIVQELLDGLARRGTVDLIADFALPLPLTVISDMMGVDERDRLKFRGWMAGFLEAPAGGPMQLIAGLPRGFQLMRFFQEQIRRRRAEPRDDLISALVAAEQAGDRLSEDELLSMIFLLLLAGHETTVNLIGNGMQALLAWPDQYARLHAEPALIDTAVEELLRFTNPVEHGTPRIALADVEVHGVPLPRGSKVLAMLSSANRDETVFERADTLDVGRQPNRHVAFGLGIHYCLGAPLARMEGKAAIAGLARRFPNMQLAVPADQLRWRSTVGVRGLKALPVKVA
jgi:cytochrome P450